MGLSISADYSGNYAYPVKSNVLKRESNTFQVDEKTTKETFSGLIAENLEDLESVKPLTSEQQRQKEKKIAAYKKLDNTVEQVSNIEFALTEKHNDALRMINRNADLAHLGFGLMEKIDGVYSQQGFLMKKLELASIATLSAAEINEVIASVNKSLKQLQQDFAKLSSGIILAGAYSEAMMLVDDNEKQAEYRKKALNILEDIPDPARNKGEEAVVDEALENIYDVAGVQEDFSGECEVEPEELIEASQNTEALVLLGEFDQETLNEQALGLGEEFQVEDDFYTFSATQQKIDDDNEIKNLKKDVEYELEKQLKDDNKDNDSTAISSNQGLEMNSILFE